MSSAFACSCPPPAGLREEADIKAWLLAKAENVVSGRILSVRAGHEINRSGSRVVEARMKVGSTIKGSVSGEITLLTGFGTGDCGIPDAFLISVAWDRDVTLEVHLLPGGANEYGVSMCGYGQIEALQ